MVGILEGQSRILPTRLRLLSLILYNPTPQIWILMAGGKRHQGTESEHTMRERGNLNWWVWLACMGLWKGPPFIGAHSYSWKPLQIQISLQSGCTRNQWLSVNRNKGQLGYQDKTLEWPQMESGQARAWEGNVRNSCPCVTLLPVSEFVRRL